MRHPLPISLSTPPSFSLQARAALAHKNTQVSARVLRIFTGKFARERLSKEQIKLDVVSSKLVGGYVLSKW
jgi:hypothetical protein